MKNLSNSKLGNWKLEVGSWKSEVRKLEGRKSGSWMLGLGKLGSWRWEALPVRRSLVGFLFVLLSLILFSCEAEMPLADAYGNFETEPVMVGTEASGKLLFLEVEEGQKLKEGQLVGLIDTVPLHLQKEQLLASLQALGQKTQEAEPEIKVLEEQKQNLLREQKRVEALLKDQAATPKQLDDIKGQVQVIDQQMAAVKRKTTVANRAILSETGPVNAQVLRLEDQIRRCYIYNPITGTVITKLAEPSEIKGFGSPLYRIAKLDTLTLRAYIGGPQLGQMKIGQEVIVRIDAADQTMRDYSGRISWVSDQAEFTPRIIQTKEERVNLVYAIKVKVANDGYLKTGMPAEVWLSSPNIVE
ncbi:MAG: efflux RND transporter periplasmic adaptor subunit [Saprospiraceae bacterium]